MMNIFLVLIPFKKYLGTLFTGNIIPQWHPFHVKFNIPCKKNCFVDINYSDISYQCCSLFLKACIALRNTQSIIGTLPREHFHHTTLRLVQKLHFIKAPLSQKPHFQYSPILNEYPQYQML